MEELLANVPAEQLRAWAERDARLFLAAAAKSSPASAHADADAGKAQLLGHLVLVLEQLQGKDAAPLTALQELARSNALNECLQPAASDSLQVWCLRN
jgi:hypothetical protein